MFEQEKSTRHAVGEKATHTTHPVATAAAFRGSTDALPRKSSDCDARSAFDDVSDLRRV